LTISDVEPEIETFVTEHTLVICDLLRGIGDRLTSPAAGTETLRHGFQAFFARVGLNENSKVAMVVSRRVNKSDYLYLGFKSSGEMFSELLDSPKVDPATPINSNDLQLVVTSMVA